MSDRDILEIVDDAVRAIFGEFSPEQTEICSFTNILKCKFIFLHSQQIVDVVQKTWSIDSIVKRCKYSNVISYELSNISHRQLQTQNHFEEK